MKILSILWQLPQNILGLMILFVNFKSVKKIDGRIKPYYSVKHLGDSGISLGEMIIMDSDRHVTNDALLHEYGHQIQSKRLGWLYLIVIGLPSLIGNILHRFIKFNYYKQPWEHNASVLGGSKYLG